MKLILLSLLASLILSPSQSKSSWRPATATELETALPARAPVEKERIETEMRTASGIINTADGKYSHYLLVQSPITIGDIALAPGAFVLGWQRTENGLTVKLYDAASGAERGTATAHRLPTDLRVESFRVWPPSDHQMIQIGRFALPYTLGE